MWVVSFFVPFRFITERDRVRGAGPVRETVLRPKACAAPAHKKATAMPERNGTDKLRQKSLWRQQDANASEAADSPSAGLPRCGTDVPQRRCRPIMAGPNHVRRAADLVRTSVARPDFIVQRLARGQPRTCARRSTSRPWVRGVTYATMRRPRTRAREPVAAPSAPRRGPVPAAPTTQGVRGAGGRRASLVVGESIAGPASPD
jgi:hypothetical protein